MRSRRWLVWAAVPLLCACGSGSGTTPDAPQPSGPSDANPAAAPPPHTQCGELRREGLLASFDGPTCGWTLRVETDGALEFVHTTLPPSVMRGEVPEPCAQMPCRFRGGSTTLGPLVLAEAVESSSEMPGGVWLGYVRDGELHFIDLWHGAGEPIVDDGVPIGPAYALAPFDCNGTLATLAMPRFSGADVMDPPADLRAREAVLVGPATTIDRDSCRALPIDLP